MRDPFIAMCLVYVMHLSRLLMPVTKPQGSIRFQMRVALVGSCSQSPLASQYLTSIDFLSIVEEWEILSDNCFESQRGVNRMAVVSA